MMAFNRVKYCALLVQYSFVDFCQNWVWQWLEICSEPLPEPMLTLHQWNLAFIHLTHWSWDEIEGILQTLSDAFRSLNENVWILINISLNFVPYGPVDYKSALVQIMAWCRAGDKPLSEPMMVRSRMHICITRPQWVKSIWKGYV